MSSAHAEIARAFVEQIDSRDIIGVEQVFLFGSAARDEAGPASDVDLFCVLDDDVDRRDTTERLRAIAFDLLLDYDTVIDVHTMSASRFGDREEHPFVRQVVRDGVAYV